MAYVSAKDFLKQKSGGQADETIADRPAGYISAKDFLAQKQQPVEQRVAAPAMKELVAQGKLPSMIPGKLPFMQQYTNQQQQPIEQSLSQQANMPTGQMSGVPKMLDYIFKENPIARVINYPFAKAAESSVPDAPMIGKRDDGSYGNLPGETAKEKFAAENKIASTGNKTLDKVLGFSGEMGSYMFNPAGGIGQGAIGMYKALSPAVDKVTSKVVPKLPALGQKMVKEAAREGATALAYAPIRSLIEGESDAAEIAKRAGIEGAMGIGLGGALPAVGAGIGKLAKNIKDKRAFNQSVNEFIERTQSPDMPQVPDKIDNRNNPFDRVNQVEQKMNNPVAEVNESVLPPDKKTQIDSIEFEINKKAEEFEQLRKELKAEKDLDKKVLINNRALEVRQEAEALIEQRNRLANETNSPANEVPVQETVASELEIVDYPFENVPEKPKAPKQEPIALEPKIDPKSLDDIVRSSGFQEVTPETIAQTYNQKKWYHGTGTDKLTVETLDPFVGSHESLFGQGIYLTDNPKIADGYANSRGRSSKTPTIYEAEVDVGRVLDLEKPITNEVSDAIQKVADSFSHHDGGDISQLIREEIGTPGITPEEVIQRLRDEISNFSHYEMVPTSEFVEFFQDLAMNLKKAGYDAITHTGGMRTGNDAHRVMIVLDPQGWHGQGGKQIKRFEKVVPEKQEAGTILPKDELLHAEPESIVSTAEQAAEDVAQTSAEPRVRDRVVSYLDDQIAEAQERLKAKRNTLSSNPLDQYADYAIIGVSYIGKGIVKLSDFTEHMVREFGEKIRPHIREIFKKSKEVYKDYEKRVQKDMQGLNGVPIQMLKDIRVDQAYTNDVFRNFEQVFGDKFPQMKKAILDPFDDAKGEYTAMQENWTDKLKTEIVDNLGIKKGSKLSSLVQQYGEKIIDIVDLKTKAPNDWEKVIEADRWFRRAYDDLIDGVNATREKIYPTNPAKIVPKREDYYRHFQEQSGLSGLYNLFDSPAQIDPNLMGISDWTSPKSKWASFMQKRSIGPYKNDAVGGFLEYLRPAAYSTHMDPFIEVFRNLSKNLAEETTDTRNINNFINFLQRFSQDLAGKTNPLDRPLQEVLPGGRKTMAFINWLNSRVKMNTVLGNAASALSQFGNIPNGIAFAKTHSIPGFGKTILSQFGKVPEMGKSTFLKERYIDKKFRQFDTRWLEIGNPLRLKSFAGWAMETTDRVSTEFIWNSAYAKAISEGIENPIRYADEWARKMVAGRGVGEVPLLQKSKVFQLIAPFQLEVANLWKVQADFIKKKDFGALATLAVSLYVFNKAMEQVRGNGVVFDPIQAMFDAYEASKDEFKPFESLGRVGGEVLSNVPLGQSIAAAYPEHGMNIFGQQLPTRQKLFGKNDPTRFGSGLTAVKGLQDPLYMVAPGFGGNQLRKSAKGIKSVLRDGDYTPDGKELKFPIDMNPLKAVQSVMFGPSATSEAREYYDKERSPLSEKQTKDYENISDRDMDRGNRYYEQLMKDREINKIQRQMDEVAKDRKLTRDQRLAKIRGLREKLVKIQKSG